MGACASSSGTTPVSGSARSAVRARLTHAIRQDTLFIPFHWGGSGRANLLTNPALDPISRMPEFKVCAARLEKDTRC
jgi:assimilatory nitrate reductase catalytic subunit